MNYLLSFSSTTEKDIIFLKKSEPRAFKKPEKLLKELQIHPFSGTGRPEVLKYDPKKYRPGSITHKHRLVYRVDKEKIDAGFHTRANNYSPF